MLLVANALDIRLILFVEQVTQFPPLRETDEWKQQNVYELVSNIVFSSSNMHDSASAAQLRIVHENVELHD